MPIAYIAVGVLTLGCVVTLIVQQRQITGLRRDLEQSARDEAASEKRIRELVGARQVVNGKPEGKKPRRHLWPVPVIAALGGLSTVLAAIRHQAGPVTAGLAGVAAITALVIVGSSTSDTRVANPPVPVGPPVQTTAPRSPSSTTSLPPPTITSATRPTLTATTVPSVTVTSMPTTTTSMPEPTLTTITTSETPTSTETPTTPCLLAVGLTPLLDLCVPAVH